MPRLNLRNKLLLFAVVIAIIPLLIAGQSLIRIARDEMKSSANDQLVATTRQVADEIDTYFEQTLMAPLLLIRSALDDEKLGIEEKIALLTHGIADLTDVVALQITIEGGNLPLVVSQDLDIGTFTQEVRLAAGFGDAIDVLLGAFYIKEDIDQSNQLLYGTDFRNYANILVQSLSGCTLSLFGPAVLPPPICGATPPRSLETTLGALQGNPGLYTGRFFPAGQGFTEAYSLDSEAISLFGQVDYEIVPGLVLTLGGNYTDDSKTFATNSVSTDVFSSIDLVAARNTLTQVGIAQTIGGILMVPGGVASPDQVAAFRAMNEAGYNQIAAGAAAATAPLLQLQALQFMPPFLNVPNSVEDGEIDDSDFSYTVRLAYDVNDTINVYASYATGFKASSVNLSRDSRPSPADRDAIIAAGLTLPNLIYTSRFAAPEESRVMEAGIKANWGDVSANLAVFDQEIKGFQSNIFTGAGFALTNAGKVSTFGVEFEGVATVLDALTVNLGVTYLDPHYDSYLISSVGDLTGTRPAGIPEWTVLVGAQYEARLGNGLLVPRVSYLHQSDVQLVEGLPGFLVRNPDGSIANAAPAIAAAAPFTVERNDLTASLGVLYDHSHHTPHANRACHVCPGRAGARCYSDSSRARCHH